MAQQALTEDEGEALVVGALPDIQRLVVSAYAHLPWARYLLLRVTDDGTPDIGDTRTWLASLIPRLSTAAVKDESLAVNVAVTAEGLAIIGISESTMATFSRAFRQGMTSEYRSRLLGDTGASAPDQWAWGRPGATPHFLLAIYAPTAEALVAASDVLTDEAAHAGVAVSHSIDSMLLPNGMEHFGFTDGVSQPVLAGTAWAQRTLAPKWESVQPGEFLFGHRDELGYVSEGPAAGDTDLGINGSYLVLRQLDQHVERFRSWLNAAAEVRGADPADVAAELIGRRNDGRSLAIGAPISGGPDRLNDFGYDQDKTGLGCPLGAHVRRANPRNSTPKPSADAEETQRLSSNRHRILRRGRPYGPTDDTRTNDEPRGLVFIALNAEIERQFEFVQHTWLNNSTFAGLCGEIDPITAEQPEGPDGGSFTVPSRPVRARFNGLPSFTTTRGGAYFFLPGLRALELIATGVV